MTCPALPPNLHPMPDPIDDKPRCFGSHSELYARYHDTEWGVPVRDDRVLSEMTDFELQKALNNPAIVRHRQKVPAARKNARVFREMQAEFGSFSDWLWGHVDGQPIKGDWATRDDIPAVTPLATGMSKDLKKRGMSFVGPMIVYAYLQAVGVVNDHYRGCWCYRP